MYQDRDSIEVFHRMHTRDRMAQLARNLDHPSEDYDLLTLHASGEEAEGHFGIWLSIVLVILFSAVLAEILGFRLP